MTPEQRKKRRKIIKSLEKQKPYFRKKYGKRGNDVMQAVATKTAMREQRILGALSILNEEVVNKENQPMTKAEIIRRDRLAKSKSIRDYVSIVNPRDKNINNAAHRYATYIVMRMRGKRGKGSATVKKSKKRKK